MNILEANVRKTNTSGDIKKIRQSGQVPGILYGGSSDNQKITVSKKLLKNLMEKENFLSRIINLKIEGKDENVLPKDISFDVITDEPIHIDFLRVIKGSSVILEIPVKFVNLENSPGLKRGGVLNIVRRKVELKCPSENIPGELIVDLDGVDIGHSFKISSIKLPENVTPTIQGRDFVIATVAAPTAAEGEEGSGDSVETPNDASSSDAKSGNDGDKKEGEKKESDKKVETKKSQPEKK